MNAFSQNAHPPSRTKPDILAAPLCSYSSKRALSFRNFLLSRGSSATSMKVHTHMRIYAESPLASKRAREILSHACLRLRCEGDNYSWSMKIAIPQYKEMNAMVETRYRHAFLAVNVDDRVSTLMPFLDK